VLLYINVYTYKYIRLLFIILFFYYSYYLLFLLFIILLIQYYHNMDIHVYICCPGAGFVCICIPPPPHTHTFTRIENVLPLKRERERAQCLGDRRQHRQVVRTNDDFALRQERLQRRDNRIKREQPKDEIEREVGERIIIARRLRKQNRRHANVHAHGNARRQRQRALEEVGNVRLDLRASG
jgi:hypothetical protein